MYTFEEKYVENFQMREDQFLNGVESVDVWWLQKKNELSEECEKYYNNGHIGFELDRNFFYSTENGLVKLKDWHQQVKDLRLPGKAVLLLIHISLVIVFGDGFKKIKDIKELPSLENIPYFKLKDDFVVAPESSFTGNYIYHFKSAVHAAQEKVNLFFTSDYEWKIIEMLEDGSTSIEIYSHPLLYRTTYIFTAELPSYLKLDIIQDKIVVSLESKYTDKIKNSNICLDVYNTKQTSIMRTPLLGTQKEGTFSKENILKYYVKGYKKRILKLVARVKEIDFAEMGLQMKLSQLQGMIGFSVLQDDYILVNFVKNVLTEINVSLPRTLSLITSATGDLVLLYNVSDKVLIENKCYGSYRNQKMFYIELEE